MAVLLLLLLLACAGEPPPAAPPTTGDGGRGATTAPRFAPLVAALRQTCEPCHTELEAGLLNFGVDASDDRRVHAALLSSTMGDHCQGMDRRRVVPGNPGVSMFYRKVLARTTAAERADCGSVMPPPGVDPLSREQVEAIRAWIEAGAPGP